MKNNTKNVKSSSLSIKSYKPYIILGVAIALGVLIYLLLPLISGVTVGQAAHQTAAGTAVSTSFASGQNVKLSSGKMDAVTGDIFTVDLSVNTGTSKIIQVDYELVLDPSISLVSAPALLSNLKTYSAPSTSNPTATIWGTDVSITGETKLATFTFKLNCPTCLTDSKKTIAFKKIYLIQDTANKFGPGETSVEVNVVPICTDVDNDGYGAKNTDARGCLYAGDKAGTTNFDCSDSNVNINPGKTEVCDGLDNNCDNLPDNGLTAPKNTKLQGACYGDQICVGIGGWKESYTVGGTKNTNTFSDASGSYSQVSLYEATETKCDFFDNDCDGSVNEGLTGCIVGAVTTVKETPTGLLPPGNAFYDYDDATLDFLNPQLISALDVNMVAYFMNADGDANFGGHGQEPYPIKLKSLDAWICDSGLYYIKESDGLVYQYNYDSKKSQQTGYYMDSTTGKLYTPAGKTTKVVC